jgi:pimeloyl-ACP methyl ester carboxylesterase
VLHGLFRSAAAMEKMADYLRDPGGYVVFNVTYSSTQNGVGEHAQALARIIANLDGIEEINFVAHSMGNIVVRHYLADHERKPDPRLRRMVMLGPPNHGSLAAFVLAENTVFKTLTGQAGQELGSQWGSIEKHLAAPTFEFGIVAGGKRDDRGFNPLLPGDNDGTISVDTTRLAGASDFIVLPVLHSFLMDDEKVKQYTLQFLRHGYFVSREARQELSK